MTKILMLAFLIGVVVLTINLLSNYDKQESEQARKSEPTINTSGITSNFKWLGDLQEGKNLAKESNKPLLVKVGANWWGGCVRLDAVMHSNNAELNQALNQFVLVKLESGAAENLNIDYIPVMIFYAPDGKEVDRKVGAMEAPQLVSFLNTMVTKAK